MVGKPTDLLFLVPLAGGALGAWLSLRASRRNPRRRNMWLALVAATGIAAFSSVLGIASGLGAPTLTAALYAGFFSSVALAAAMGLLAREALRSEGWPAMVDALLPAGVLATVCVHEVVAPAFAKGDTLLALVVVVDIAAFLLAAAAVAGPAAFGIKGWLLGLTFLTVVADGIAAANSAGEMSIPVWVVPLSWGLASFALAYAATREGRTIPAPAARPVRGLLAARTLLPLLAIVGYPVLIGVMTVVDGGQLHEHIVAFGPVFVLSTAIAFARQAVLLVEQRRATQRERELADNLRRRNRELEALTGLATTITEVLQEGPVLSRGLEALTVAAHTSGAALHLSGEQGLTLAATTGAWTTERVWASAPVAVPGKISIDHIGGRQIARLPITARGHSLGLVTLVRHESEGVFHEDFGLLRLLVDQLGVALQNVRDHREKLEAAVRDPLTGLYNRRFFYEAFAQEVARHERYGTGAAVVIFDVDNLRAVNDMFGHQQGDAVLEQVGRIVSHLVRPSDTFARIGDEEFGLLMPETGQLDALLVAERLRTAVARGDVLGDHKVTLSGGVAALPQDGTTREQLQQRAEQALAWAKRNGKNMCAVASEVNQEEAESTTQGMLAHLHGVVAGIDAEALHTRDHSENVASYAVAIGQAIGLDEERIVRLRRAAFLHDIGKVAVDHAILEKPSGLSDAEYEAIKVHPVVGETMLHHAGLHDEARWIGAHHERLDGAGYPHGLREQEIPLESRIIFVADSFEAMTSDRPYRRGMSTDAALEELKRCAHSQFDPEVVRTFVSLVENDELAVMALRES